MKTYRSNSSAFKLAWRRLIWRCKCGEDGGALVELASVLPIFVALLAGAAEFAILSYQSIEVSEAARAGAAYGSRSTTKAADTTGMQNAAVAASPDVSGLTASAKEFYSCSNTPSVQNSTPPTCASGHGLTYVQVTTSATVTLPVHLPGLTSFTLNGLAIMRVQ